MLQVKEEFAALVIIEHEVKLLGGLEGESERHQERMREVLQDLALGLGMFNLVAGNQRRLLQDL